MSGDMREQIEQTFDVNAPVYDRSGVSFFRPVGARLADLVGPPPGGRVLDIGCGRGAVLFPLAEAVGPSGEVVGIDVAKGMLDTTVADLASAGHTNVRLHRMDGADPDFEPSSFDAITGSMSIIMIPDLPDVFPRYARLLRPDGTLGFTAPRIDPDADAQLGPFSVREMLEQVREAFPSGELDAMHETYSRFAGRYVETTLETLRQGGFSDATCHTETMTITADSAQDIVDWSWGTGMRMFWELLDPERRSTMEERARERAEAMRDEEGKIVFPVDIHFFLAKA